MGYVSGEIDELEFHRELTESNLPRVSVWLIRWLLLLLPPLLLMGVSCSGGKTDV